MPSTAKQKLEILQADNLNFPWLTHGFSTRVGGFSKAYGGHALNLGFTHDDHRETVERNRAAFLHALGADDWPIASVRQIHSDIIWPVITAGPRGPEFISAYDQPRSCHPERAQRVEGPAFDLSSPAERSGVEGPAFDLSSRAERSGVEGPAFDLSSRAERSGVEGPCVLSALQRESRNGKRETGNQHPETRNAKRETAVIHAGDGLLTATPGLLLAIRTADCLPILLADPKRRAVAALHCGWRPTLKRMAEKGVGEMRRWCGSRPEDLRAAIGPGIHACCYQVGEEVRDQFRSQFAYADELFTETKDSHEIHERYPLLFLVQRAPGHIEPHLPVKIRLDLVEANRRQLLAAGLRARNITASPLCTSCRTDLLFSYRAEDGVTGRLMAVIGIRSSR